MYSGKIDKLSEDAKKNLDTINNLQTNLKNATKK